MQQMKPVARARRANPPTAKADTTQRGAGLPRFLAPAAAPPVRLRAGAPGHASEHEADTVAERITNAAPHPTATSPACRSAAAAPSSTPLPGLVGNGRPLDTATRGFMESRFDFDFSAVRVHTGPLPASLNRDLGAAAFTEGNHIFYGAGRGPGRDALTAHELAHVVQRAGGAADVAGVSLGSSAAAAPQLQCSFTGSYLIPGSSDGVFEIDLQTREGALGTPAANSGLDGYIRFVPSIGAPNSNSIAFTQVNSTKDGTGADINSASMPAAQAPRGALGTPGLRTEADPLRGVEAGFKTDVHHRPNASAPGVAQGTALSPRYNFQPTPAGGTSAPGLLTPQPALYGGATGGVVGQTRGFKRSDDLADIRSAAMYDFPGTTGATGEINWEFESAALGEDTQLTYGVVNWGFGVHDGHVVNEHLSVATGTSATFGEAMERHRDFYVHEPVTFYFPFDSAVLSGTEAAKIDSFLPYLARAGNADVHMALQGFADIAGGFTDYNQRLSQRRVVAVREALLARGIAAARIDAIVGAGWGASDADTADAGTGDQGGNAATGADQTREANRWANREVTLTFRHVPAGP